MKLWGDPIPPILGFPSGLEVKNSPAKQGTWVGSLGREDPPGEEMAICSSILAWVIPWIEEPGRLQSMGWQSVRHDLATQEQQTTNSTHRPCTSCLKPGYYCYYYCFLRRKSRGDKLYTHSGSCFILTLPTPRFFWKSVLGLETAEGVVSLFSFEKDCVRLAFSQCPQLTNRQVLLD